jgi:hypothetical protein
LRNEFSGELVYDCSRRSAVRLYFHLKDSRDVIQDPVGAEVSDLEAARAQALRAIDELRREDASAAQDWSGWTLMVADASGAVLLALNLDPEDL